MAGFIPQSFIDDLLSRADIVDVVGACVTLRKPAKITADFVPFTKKKRLHFPLSQVSSFIIALVVAKVVTPLVLSWITKTLNTLKQ